jgi:hypothetical protein
MASIEAALSRFAGKHQFSTSPPEQASLKRLHLWHAKRQAPIRIAGFSANFRANEATYCESQDKRDTGWISV